MYYFLASILIFFIIFFIEFKKKSMFTDSYSIINSSKCNFNVFKFLGLSILFASVSTLIIIIFENIGFISNDTKTFKISLLPSFIFLVLIVPVIEEYFYRFLPYSFKTFNNHFIYILIIFISGVLFTSFHNTSFYESILIFFMSIVFSLIYLSTKNILYSIGCHALYNLFILIRVYVIFDSLIFLSILVLIGFILLLIYMQREKSVRDVL